MDDHSIVVDFKNKVIMRVNRSTCPESPRAYDNLGTLCCKHPKYVLGDKTEFESLSELRKYISENKDFIISIPVYIYDHSGISYHTHPIDRWDTTFVGYNFVSYEDVKKAYGITKITDAEIKKAKQQLADELVALNDHYATEYFDYTIESGTNVLESCGDIPYVGNSFGNIFKEYMDPKYANLADHIEYGKCITF